MAKPELGTKRTCPNCGTKYYDLNRDPIICPRCGTEFQATTTAVKVRAPAAPPPPVEEEEIVAEAVPDAELVPLEEADEEVADTGAVKIEGAADEDEEESEAGAEETFLEPEEEDGDDVADIIGGVDEEEP